LIEGYDITTETGEVIGKTKSLTDAENRVNRATELRKQRQLQLLDAKQKIQENIAKGEQAMADLEALGKKGQRRLQKDSKLNGGAGKKPCQGRAESY
jgi:prefoldin subunit 5